MTETEQPIPLFSDLWHDIIEAARQDNVQRIKQEISDGLTDEVRLGLILYNAAMRDAIKVVKFLYPLVDEKRTALALAGAAQFPSTPTFLFLAENGRYDAADSEALFNAVVYGDVSDYRRLIKNSNTEIVIERTLRECEDSIAHKLQQVVDEEIAAGNKKPSYQEQVIRDIRNNDIEAIKNRMDNGEDLTFEEFQPFRLACRFRKTQIALLLLEISPVDNASISCAVTASDDILLKSLLPKAPQENEFWKYECLSAATRNEDEKIINILLDYCNPDEVIGRLHVQGLHQKASMLVSLADAHRLRTKSLDEKERLTQKHNLSDKTSHKKAL